MPGTTPTSRADIAIATGASGTYLKSQGPGQMPVMTAISTLDVVGLDTELSVKADDSAVLKLAGDQSASGKKTITVYDRGGGIYNVLAYGLVPDGTTDNTSSLNTLLATVYAAGGGVIHWPAGVYRINGQIILPNDGATVPDQPGITWRGCSPDFRGRSGNPTGGTILDLRYGTSGDWKIKTLGVGFFGLEGITLRDSGTNSSHFILTTNTTLRIVGCAFLGNPSKGTGTCDQDAITLGGTDASSSGLDTSPFQGYGTVINGNYFNHVRRAVYGRMYCNGVQIVNNTTWQNCGSNLANDGLIVLEGAPGNACTGNYIAGNLIEMNGGQSYGIKLAYSAGCSVVGNNFFDPVPATVSYVRFESTATYNIFISGFSDDTHPEVSEGTSGTNTVITGHQSQRTLIPQGLTVGPLTTNNTALFAGGASCTIIQPGVAQTNDSVHLIEIKRSALESVNPGGDVLRVRQNGEFLVDGTGSGNYIGTYVSWTGNGRIWTALGAGGEMTWDSGPGGSYQNIKGYGQRFYSHTNTLIATIGAAVSGINLGSGYTYKIGGTTVLSYSSGVSTISGILSTSEVRIGGFSFSRIGIDADGGPYVGYNLKYDGGYKYDSLGGLAGITFGPDSARIHAGGNAAADTASPAVATFTSTAIYLDKPVTVAGSVTADAFVGDGSGLTNLPGGGGGGSTLAFVATASKTIANTTTETSLFGTGVGSLTIPAGTLTPGKTYRIRLMGNTTAASGANQFRVTLGGVTLWVTSSNTMTVAANQVTILEATFTCRATGATNTVMAAALVTTLTSSSAQRYGGASNEFVTANVDTTIDNAIDATVKFSAADPGNTITITNAIVEALN